MKKLTLFAVIVLFNLCINPILSQDIEFSAFLEKKEVSLGEELLLRITVTNKGDSTKEIHRPSIQYNSLSIQLEKRGNKIKYPYHFRMLGTGISPLEPNKSFNDTLNIMGMFDFINEEGLYEILISYSPEPKNEMIIDSLSFYIRRPTSQELEEHKLFLHLKNLRNYEQIVEKGFLFLDKYPKSKYLESVKFKVALGLKKIKEFDKCIELLEEIIYNDTISNRSKTSALKALANLYFYQLKNKDKALETLDKLNDAKQKNSIQKRWRMRMRKRK